MANWQYKISIKSVHDLFDGEDNIERVGAAMATRLRDSKPRFLLYPDREFLERLAKRFDVVEDVDRYDQLLDNLYDWGDADHKCWINSYA